jgi:peroxiredoxin
MLWRGSNPQIEQASTATLAERLEQITMQVAGLVPAEKRRPPEQWIEELCASGASERVLPVGGQAPDFELPDVNKQPVRSRELLARGRLVIAFYRGRWCPYCVAELEALRDVAPEIAARGAALVAISPQTVQQSSFTAEQHGLRFPVLSDAGNRVARQFGVATSLPDSLRKHYRRVFINLQHCNGDTNWELPLPAAFILERDGRVLWRWADADFRHRAEPTEILKVLRS